MGFLGKFEEEKDILKTVEIEGKKALEEQGILQELTKEKLAELTIEITRAKKQNERQDNFLRDTEAVAQKNAIQLEKLEEKERKFLENLDIVFQKKMENLEERDRAFLETLEKSKIFDEIKKDLKATMADYKDEVKELEKEHGEATKKTINNMYEHHKEILNRMYVREWTLFIAVAILTVALIFTSFKIVSVKNEYENIHQNYAKILQKLEKK